MDEDWDDGDNEKEEDFFDVGDDEDVEDEHVDENEDVDNEDVDDEHVEDDKMCCQWALKVRGWMVGPSWWVAFAKQFAHMITGLLLLLLSMMMMLMMMMMY